MTGGSGVDTVQFVAPTDLPSGLRDEIRDFMTGLDKISFAGLGLTFIASGGFTGANQIRYLTGLSLLEIDVNGDGTVDGMVELSGVGADFVAATDLIL
jgi:serralysin